MRFREGLKAGCKPLRDEWHEPELPKQERRMLNTWKDVVSELVIALDEALGVDRRNAPTEREHCCGNTAIWKDDESGGSSSWDSVVRAYEDNK